jgi:hypothetical protein
MISIDLIAWLAIVVLTVAVAYVLSPEPRPVLRRSRVHDLTPVYHLARNRRRGRKS